MVRSGDLEATGRTMSHSAKGTASAEATADKTAGRADSRIQDPESPPPVLRSYGGQAELRVPV